MFKNLKLNDHQRLCLKEAKKGMLPGELSKELKAIIEGKAELPKHHPITIFDDTYDGPKDKSETINFIPSHPINILFGHLQDRLGPFGHILAVYLLSYGSHPKAKAARYIRDLKKTLWKDVSF